MINSRVRSTSSGTLAGLTSCTKSGGYLLAQLSGQIASASDTRPYSHPHSSRKSAAPGPEARRESPPPACHLCPPETEMRSPVTHADWSEARNSATLAMSSALPIRPHGQGEAERFRALGAQACGGETFGFDHAGRNGVDPDSLAGKLNGELARDRFNRTLRGRVDERVRRWVRARDGARLMTLPPEPSNALTASCVARIAPRTLMLNWR